MIRRGIVVAIGALLLVATPTDAHLMPEGQGSSHIVGDKAYSLISLPVEVLTGFDDDHNGLISMLEARVHAATLQEQIDRRIQLLDGNGVPGRTVYADLQVPHFDSSSAILSAAVIQIRVSQWDAPPTALRVRADIFTRKQPDLTFRTIIGDSTETGKLSARRPEYKFFMGPNANPPLPEPQSIGGTASVLIVLALGALAAMLIRRRRTPSVQPAGA